ncbi:MAG: site-specific integrase, partial [Legionella sp.]|nr:site-specific integrase [Legionella sp.]
MTNLSPPKPLFDTLEQLLLQAETCAWTYLDDAYNLADIAISSQFLLAYKGSQGTFNGYRREVERFLHWSVLSANKTLADLNREDIEEFIEFSQLPPKHWIGTSKPARFLTKNALRVPNPAWRPYVVTVSKAAHRRGQVPEIKNFELSQSSLRELFAILSSFY